MLEWLKEMRKKQYDTSKETVTRTGGITSKDYKGKSVGEIARSNRKRRKILKKK
jgi:hypothetical protein